MCARVKINYNVCVDGKKGSCGPMQQWGSLERKKIHQTLDTHTILLVVFLVLVV